ncbi:Sensor histidine kinase RcsC [Sporomusa carbonis]
MVSGPFFYQPSLPGHSDIEGALLVLVFFAVALAVPLAGFLLNNKNGGIFLSVSSLALCAGVSLFAQMDIKNFFVDKPLFWEYIAMTAVYFVPAALYSCVRQSLGPDRHEWLLARLGRLHIVFAVGSLLAVATHIVISELTMDSFQIVTLGTGAAVAGIVVKRARQGRMAAKIIVAGIGLGVAFTGSAVLCTGLGKAWPLRYTQHWGLCIIIMAFLLMVRRQLFEENANSRKMLGRMWRMLSSAGSQAELKNSKAAGEPLAQVPVAAKAAQGVVGLEYQSERHKIDEDRIARFVHEISSPLGTSIMAASYLGQEVEELSVLFKAGAIKKSDLERHLNVYSESADIILTNLQGAVELVKSFRNPAAGQFAEQRQVFDVKEVIEQLMLRLKPRLRQAGHQMRLICAAGLRMNGFPGLLSQIFTNLIINSLIHAYDEGIQGTIVLNIFQEGNMVVFEYSDDGKGMSEDTLQHVFDPFFTTNREHGGTGLGLSIVNEIVTTKFGGSIACRSTEGQGSIFTIRLPIGEG